MIYYNKIEENEGLSFDELRSGLVTALDKLGSRKKILVVPPDYTRFHSQAGILTKIAFEYYGNNLTDILPALGTHVPMTIDEIEGMYSGIPKELFRIHNWRCDVVSVGTIKKEEVASITDNTVNFDWPVQLNQLIMNGGHDLILSIGQVVPHEVIGMANYNKNLFVGAGGDGSINKSHFIGAVYGMEKLMGKADNPLRKLLNLAAERFTKHLPIVYVHTVVARNNAGSPVVKGLFVGDDEKVFQNAADLSLRLNLILLEYPLKKVVVWLDPSEYHSTWLGNKSIYRTRMALGDHAELVILAPGLKEFGEDVQIDALIRKYGYYGRQKILKATNQNYDLKNNLSAAAHLIHGSSEGRFKITYCPGKLSQSEIESVGFSYGSLSEMLTKYDPFRLNEGFNTVMGEEIYFISNPALGLWALKDQLTLI